MKQHHFFDNRANRSPVEQHLNQAHGLDEIWFQQYGAQYFDVEQNCAKIEGVDPD